MYKWRFVKAYQSWDIGAIIDPVTCLSQGEFNILVRNGTLERADKPARFPVESMPTREVATAVHPAKEVTTAVMPEDRDTEPIKRGRGRPRKTNPLVGGMSE